MQNFRMTDNFTEIYDTYLDLWETGNRNHADEITFRQLQRMIQKFTGVFGPFSYAIQDYSSGNFLYVDEDISRIWGYEADLFYEEGIRFFLNILLPRYNELHYKLFRIGWEYVHQLDPKDILMVSANFDHPSRKKTGELCRILSRQIVVRLDDDNKIWLCIALFTDISHIKAPDINDPTKLSIHIPKKRKLLVNTPSGDSLIDLEILTVREREILRLYADDNTTREIAEELFISRYTVQTHRNNLLKKTGCKNLAELVHFSKCHINAY